MAIGGEIKSVLTLDATNFGNAVESAVSKLGSLNKGLKGAETATGTFEKSIGGLDSSLKGTLDGLKGLDASVSGLTKKIELLSSAAGSRLSQSTSSAKKNTTDLADSVSSASLKMEAMTNWLKDYGGSLESLNPLIAGVVRSNRNLAESNGLVNSSVGNWVGGYAGSLKSLRAVVADVSADQVKMATSAKVASAEIEASMSRETRARLKALETERATNAELVTSRKAMLVELARVQREMDIGAAFANKKGTVSKYTDPVTGEKSEYLTYRPKGRNLNTEGSADELALYRTQSAEATATIGHIRAVISEIEHKNAETVKSIGLIRQEATAARDAAEAEAASVIAAKKAIVEKRDARRLAVQEGRAARVAMRDSYREVTQAARESAALRREIASGITSHEREQTRQITQMWRGMAAMYGATKIEGGLGKSVSAASGMEQAQVGMRALNYSDAENRQILASSAQMSQELKFLSATEALKSHMSAIASIGHNSEELIAKTLSTAAMAANNMTTLGFAHGDMQQNIRNMYGVVEMRQQTQSSEKTNSTFEALQKIVVGTQGKVTVSDIETLLRRVGQGANQLSDNGLYNLAAIVDQFKVSGGEGGSGGGVSTVGTMIKMFQAYAIGKGKSSEAVREFAGAGILDTGSLDLSQDKAGILKSAKNAGFNNQKLWMTDPVAAMQEIMPKIIEYTQRPENLKKFYQGQDKSDEGNQLAAVSQYLARLGITQSAITGLMVAADPRSQERIKLQTETMKGSKPINQVSDEEMKTYEGSMKSMKASAENLGVTLGNVLLPPLESVLRTVGGAARVLSDFGNDHSGVAAVVVWSGVLAGLALAAKGVSAMFGMTGISASALGNEVMESFGKMTAAGRAKMAQDVLNAETALQEAQANTAAAGATLTRTRANVALVASASEEAAANELAARSALHAATAEEAAATAALIGARAKQAAAVGSVDAAAADTALASAESRVALASQAVAAATTEASLTKTVAMRASTSLAVSENLLVAAETRAATAATAETVAVTALSVAKGVAAGATQLMGAALTLLGGPIGIAILAIAGIAYMWDTYGDSAEKAAKRTEDATDRMQRALHGLSSAKDVADGASAVSRKKKEIADLKSTPTPQISDLPGYDAGEDVPASTALKAQIAQEEAGLKKLEETQKRLEENEQKRLARAEVDQAKLKLLNDRTAKDMERAATAAKMGTKAAGKDARVEAKTPEEIALAEIKADEDAVAAKNKATTDAAAKKVVDSTVPDPKHMRGFEDGLTKILANIGARADETRLKIKSLLSGEQSYREQAREAIVGRLVGGQMDKGGESKNRSYVKKSEGYSFKNGAYFDKKGMAVDPTEAIDFSGKYVDGNLVTDPATKTYAPTKAGGVQREKDSALYAQAHSINDAIAKEKEGTEGEAVRRNLEFAVSKYSALAGEIGELGRQTSEGLTKDSDALKALKRELRGKEGATPTLKTNKDWIEYRDGIIAAQGAVDKLQQEQKGVESSGAIFQTLSDELERGADSASESLGRETDAMRALQAEFAKIEKANPGVDVENGGKYASNKARALEKRAALDMQKYSFSTSSATEAINAKLLRNQDGTVKDGDAAQRDIFNAENLKSAREFKTLQKELAKQTDALRENFSETSVEVQSSLGRQIKAQQTYTDFVKARAREQEEALLTPVEKLALEWHKTFSQIQGYEANWASGFISMLESALDTGKLDFKSFAASVLKDLRHTFLQDWLGDPIKNGMKSIGDTAMSAMFSKKQTTGAVEGATQGGSDVVWDALKNTVSSATSSLKGFWNSIVGSTDAVGESIAKEGLDLIMTTSKTGAETAATASLVAFTIALNAATASAAGNSAGGLMSAVPSFFAADGGINAFNSSVPLHAYARGGIATSPQLALFGEAGPEAYVPLPDGRTIPVTMSGVGSGAGGQQNISISISVASDGKSTATSSGQDAAGWKDMAEKVKSVVLQELATQSRPGGMLAKA